MARPKSRWSIKWSEKHIFKAEQEGDNISLNCVDDWCNTLDSQLFERFGPQPPRLAAASLNFSRCNLDDEALTKLLTFLYSRDITVQIMKLFRNNITDGGAWAVGQFMAHSSQAVHEVHLSHNSITERGACGLLEQIAWSRKYPYDATAGGRDGRGLSPIWLRLEHNCIDWRVINHRLQRPDLTWCTAESRDGWLMSDQAPTICLHGSYRNQHDKVTWEEGDWGESAPESGKVLLAALKGDASAQGIVGTPAPPATQHHLPTPPPPTMRPRPTPAPLSTVAAAPVRPKPQASPISPVLSTSPIGDKGGSIISPSREKAPLLSSTPMQSPQGRVPTPLQMQETEAVPIFVFADAGAMHQMVTREDGHWRFSGLLNLAASGHMKCSPLEESTKRVPYWVAPVQEGETIVTFITQDVLKEMEKHLGDPLLQDEFSRYTAKDPESLLQQCEEWGIMEVVDTSMHTSLMHVTKEMEARAAQLQIDQSALKVLDFACVWQQQAESPGRVLVITEDQGLRHMELPNNFPGVLMLGELNKLLWQDDTGRRLSEIASQPRAPQPTWKGAMLSASVIVKVAQMRQKTLQERPEVLEQREEIHQAFSLISKVLRFTRAGHRGTLSIAEQAAQTARMEAAIRRWRDLLVQVY